MVRGWFSLWLTLLQRSEEMEIMNFYSSYRRFLIKQWPGDTAEGIVELISIFQLQHQILNLISVTQL